MSNFADFFRCLLLEKYVFWRVWQDQVAGKQNHSDQQENSIWLKNLSR